jgi:hypothetical protein
MTFPRLVWTLLLPVLVVGCPTRTVPLPYDGSAAGREGEAGTMGTAGAPTGPGGQSGAPGGSGGHLDGGTGAAGGVAGGVGTGGVVQTGGTLGTGGTVGGGGTLGTGGAVGTGGVVGTGGTAGAGGAGGTPTGGSSGKSGAAGSTSGGAGGAPAGKPLGSSCGSGTDCTSGHCETGVCCDQSCTGMCQQCSTAGHCQMPPDDPACGTIACPTDTACRDYATAITTNRCKQLGQCKTPSDCSFVVASTTKACGSYDNDSNFTQYCDSNGNCSNHTVKCGGDGDCAVGDMLCCGVSLGYSCIAAGSGCPTQSGGAPPLGPYDCDETADCSGGAVCCAFSTPGGVSTTCTTSCAPAMFQQVFQVCNPNSNPSECQSGACKPTPSDWNVPQGFYFCQ